MSAQSTIAYARSYFGVWYRYGGKSRFAGMDCSGFVSDVLRHDRVVGLKTDLDSLALYEYLLKAPGTTIPKAPYPPGTVLFFGYSTDKINHVALVTDGVHMIESAGGDHTTLTFDQAVTRNAGVREVPISTRINFVTCVLPKYIE